MLRPCASTLAGPSPSKLATGRLVTHPRRWLSALLVGACLQFPLRAAHAADDDATTGMARERFKEGVSYFDKKEYDKARAAFLQAYALKHHPAVLLNLAQSELRSGHEADAATHFAQFLRESKEATDSERQSAEAGLSAAKAVAAELTVNVDEEGASITLDGSAQGQSPLPGPLYLTPGPHTITAKKDGREVSVQINAAAGQSSSTQLRFKKTTPAAEAASKEEENAEEEPEKAPESASSGQQTQASGPASERKPFFQWVTQHPVGIAGGVITVVGVGGGIGFAIAASSSYNSADSVATQIRNAAAVDMIDHSGVCLNGATNKLTMVGYEGGDPAKIASRAAAYADACEKYQDKSDAGDSAKQWAAISFVAAGVAAAGTLAFYYLEGSDQSESARSKPRRRATVVAPWITGSERGVFLVGEF